MPLDIALAYDPVHRRGDVVFNGTDFAVDTTWQTPVMMCMGCARRAHPDDEVPTDVLNLPAGAPLMNTRGGWPGDMLDPFGELTGNRGWILTRSKLNEVVRQKAQAMDTEALSPLVNRLGLNIKLTVQIYDYQTLAHRVQVNGQTVVVPQVVGT